MGHKIYMPGSPRAPYGAHGAPWDPVWGPWSPGARKHITLMPHLGWPMGHTGAEFMNLYPNFHRPRVPAIKFCFLVRWFNESLPKISSPADAGDEILPGRAVLNDFYIIFFVFKWFFMIFI